MEVLQVIFYAIPYLIAAGLAVLFILIGGVSASRPALLAFPFLLVLYWASEISYGQLVEGGGSLYSKGSGVLLFPAMIWAMALVVTWLKFSEQFSKSDRAMPVLNLHGWFLAWLLLLMLHVGVGALQDQPFRDAIGPSGFSNVIWIWLFMAVLLAAFRTDTDIKWLLRFILVVGLARALFGLVRWAAFGGDPANAYANRHGLSLKLTFFDVYDSLICMLTICVAAMQLFAQPKDQRLAGHYRTFLWVCMVVSVMCIVLSFRRSASVGLLVAGAFLLLQLPVRARLKLLLLGAPVAMAGIGYAVWKRLSQTKHAGGFFDFLFDVTPAQVGPDSPRLLELKLAWASFLDHPIFGVGSWGSYEGWRQVSWQLYEGGGGTYLHSGVLHIGLKSGLIGLVLFIGLVASFVLFWRRIGKTLTGDAQVLAVAGVAGCLFIIPDFVIATSLTKYRAVFFIGFCMALPYIGYAVELARTRRAANAATSPTAGPAAWSRRALGAGQAQWRV